jgi:hypothetical protein
LRDSKSDADRRSRLGNGVRSGGFLVVEIDGDNGYHVVEIDRGVIFEW